MVDLEEGADFVAAFPYRAGREAPRGELRRARLHRRRPTRRRQYAQGQAGPERRRARREPWSAPRPTGDHVAIVGENRKLLVFPLDAGAGNGPRQGRAPAALQGRRRLRRQGLRAEGGPDLEGHVRPAPGRWRRPTCATGSATAPRPAACRRRAFRRTTDLGEATTGSSLHGHAPRLGPAIHVVGTARLRGMGPGPGLVHRRETSIARNTTRTAPSLAAGAAPAA